MLLPRIITDQELIDLSDFKIKEHYFLFVSFVQLLDDKIVIITEKAEFDVRTHFRRVKRECESRFHVSEFPMSI